MMKFQYSAGARDVEEERLARQCYVLRWWRKMFRPPLFAVVFGTVLASLPAAAQPHTALFGEVDGIVKTLSEITGWQVRRKVPSEIVTRESFRKSIEDHTKGRSAEKEIHAEELALKLFGLVPQDFSLARETVDLLDEQAAAYYDYKKKRLFILDSTPAGSEQRMALVHELAHALADQQHPLGKYLDKGKPDSDESTAREAVMEGQATWLTWAYEEKLAGRKAEPSEDVLAPQDTDAPSDGSFPVLNAAPLYVRESLLFPYDSGARFQDAVYHRLGAKAFNEVFERGPASTQQVLHAGDYFDHKEPKAPELPKLAVELGAQARDYRALIGGAVGEFDHEILLQQYTDRDTARAAAMHWRGGEFRVFEHKKESAPVLLYASEWDSPEAARTFFSLYERVLQKKWKTMRVASRTATEITGTGDNGKFTVRIVGSGVQSIEGFK